ncbi:hypothetical protein NQ315_005243 [Exocentrus adspersus]|uniref:Carboxylic ester hydrolase n=1 Tax=Exocentrus adspersus TaxID=1586481 RepID=A0AAV8W2K2_9CUCU|nr:hypothetical protein NQ315_005243 [Exocentrus adspersus]
MACINVIAKRQIGEHPVVSIPNGKVRGTTQVTVGQKKVYHAFRGIPYAEPPIGERRFKAPVKKSRWVGTLNATEDKCECLQLRHPPGESEDCLYINVYTPRLHDGKIPVMVWIHAGGFSFGNSSYALYGPDYLLEETIVFVSFNYRLGFFGFFSTGDSACPGNFGLKDQIMALKWVQENIIHFGGDPEKVTVAGGSAGAASFSYLQQTELAKGLFRSGIMESGTSLCVWALGKHPEAAMYEVEQALNISTSNSTILIDEMRKIDYRVLQKIESDIATRFTFGGLKGSFVFGPVKEPGVVNQYSEQALSEGRFQRMPMIIGVNSNEGLIETNETVDQFLSKLGHLLPLAPKSLTKNITKLLEADTEIKNYYFGTSPIAEQPESVSKFIGDNIVNRPVRRTVLNQSKFVPVYYYKFSYVGLLGSPQNRSIPGEGVGHGEEIPYLFRTNDTVASSEADILTRARMVKMWTNFVKFGIPTPTKDDLLQNITWLTAPAGSDLFYLDIDTDLSIQRNPFEDAMNFWDRIYEEFGDPPYDTY